MISYNLRFPGQVFDGQAGLHQNVNRDYDPAVGRYVESDPIGLWGEINTYSYARGNSMADRIGLDTAVVVGGPTAANVANQAALDASEHISGHTNAQEPELLPPVASDWATANQSTLSSEL